MKLMVIMNYLQLILLSVFVAAIGSTKAAGQEQSDDKLYFLQKRSRNNDARLLIVTLLSGQENGAVGNCEITTDRRHIRKILSSVSEENVREVTETEMDEAIAECNEVVETSRRRPAGQPTTSTPMMGPSKTTTEGYEGWNVIFPGTKWCGAGDVADNYDDLGLYADTDKCCRAHDHCNDTLAPGESRSGLSNTSPFTTLNCKCDDDFYNCLEKVDTMISNKIGNLYFNLLKRKCYQYDYPKSKKCKTYRSFLRITCKEYEKNTDAPKKYQWRPAKLYKKLPIPGPFSIELPF